MKRRGDSERSKRKNVKIERAPFHSTVPLNHSCLLCFSFSFVPLVFTSKNTRKQLTFDHYKVENICKDSKTRNHIKWISADIQDTG